MAELLEAVRSLARPLTDGRDLDPLMEMVGDRKYVLLGEASHGTHEYYTWRAETSKRLISEKGFTFVGVEGDWPDCYAVNRYVKGYANSGKSAKEVLNTFERWPAWMWANREVAEFIEWLREHNEKLPEDRKVGFYGLDVYSLWDSMKAVVEYLREKDPEAVRAAIKAYLCFEPYYEDVEEYARATAFVPASCEDEVVEILSLLKSRRPTFDEDGREAYFCAEQNALVARNAERYYRTMIRGGSRSWNIRDTDMVETLERLMGFHGPQAKGIVWEHNTHIGDARFTDMANGGMVNVGQLVRELHGEDSVALVGFGSFKGSVIAGAEWDAPMEVMTVPPARQGSWEHALHEAEAKDKLLLFDDREHLERMLFERRGHRAIGVVYNPAYESGNYVPTILPWRYDAFIYIDSTQALHPLRMEAGWEEEEVPETYPSAV